MDYPNTIGELLGIGTVKIPPELESHPWNQLLGIELELEDVTNSQGSSIYNDDLEFNPYTLMSEDEWDDLSYAEQDDIREEWCATNSAGIPAGWTTHLDASLRNGIEFVTSPAVGGQALADRISAFYKCNYNYKGGPRTSTHIHVDVTNDKPVVVQSLVMLVYAIEDALYQAVDPGRKWAGYSAALSDMPASRLRNLLNPIQVNQFIKAVNVVQNRERYYGLNFHVGRHGTVEFRYFPGAPSETELNSWVDLVVAIKKAAQAFTPDQIINRCNSPENFAHFLQSNLGYWGNRFLALKGADALYSSFEEVVALRSDDTNPERVSSVVVLSPVLFSFILERYLNNDDAAKAYLQGCGIPGKALSLEDVNYYISMARNLAKKQQGRTNGTEAVDYYNSIVDTFSSSQSHNPINTDIYRHAVSAARAAMTDTPEPQRRLRTHFGPSTVSWTTTTFDYDEPENF